MEHQHRTWLAGRRDNPALFDERGDGFLVERPQWIRGCLLVMARRQHAVLVAARYEHQRSVDRHHLVHKHCDIHCARLWHAVIARPGAVILMPLPDVALERRLGVDLELMHVEFLAEHLLDRPDQPRMIAKETEGLVVGVRGKGGARRAGFFAPDLLSVAGIDLLGLIAQNRDLFLREAVGQKQITLFSELLKLLRGELHQGFLPMRSAVGSNGARFRRRHDWYGAVLRALRPRHRRRARDEGSRCARPKPAGAARQPLAPWLLIALNAAFAPRPCLRLLDWPRSSRRIRWPAASVPSATASTHRRRARSISARCRSRGCSRMPLSFEVPNPTIGVPILLVKLRRKKLRKRTPTQKLGKHC